MEDIIIKIKPKHVERLIFTFIILALVAVVGFLAISQPIMLEQPFFKKSTEVTEPTPTTETKPVETVTPPKPVTTPTEPKKTEPTPAPTTTGDQIKHSDATIKITDWKFEEKVGFEGTGSISEISVTIENGLSEKILLPTIEIYVFDGNDDPTLKAKPRRTVVIEPVDAKKISEQNVVFDKITFTETDVKKTVIVKLFDDKDMLAEVTEEITFG